jgi:hypothetical protein
MKFGYILTDEGKKADIFYNIKSRTSQSSMVGSGPTWARSTSLLVVVKILSKRTVL